MFIEGMIAHFTFSDMCKVQWGHKVHVQLSQGRSRDGIPGKGPFEPFKG